jgi:hypothetical protein
MKRAVLLLLVFLVGAALPLSSAVSGQVDFVSRYVWRGFDLLYNNKPAVQPSLDVEFGDSGFSLNVWSSFALANREEFKSADEIDLTLTYAFKVPEGWELCAGICNYGYWFMDDFNVKDGTSQEVYATVSKTDLPLAPTVSLYYDFNLGSGLYVTLGGSHELKVSENVSVELSGLIGFNSRQYIEKSGFSDVDFSARVPLVLGKVTLTPSFNVMIPLMDEVNENTEFWFGLSASI